MSHFIRLFIFFIPVSYLAIGNNQSKYKIPDNKSIKYEVVRKSPNLINDSTYIPSKHLIIVDITTKEKKLIKKIDKTTWLTLLADDKTDWAANLLLYYIYQKDALLYTSVIKSRTDWLKTEKDNDLKYWKTVLK